MEIKRLFHNDLTMYSAELLELMELCMKAGFSELAEDNYCSKKMDELGTYLQVGRAYLFGAFEEEKLKGFLWGHRMSSLIGESFHIAYFSVSPEARRKGLGQALLQAAEKEAQQLKLNRIDLIVTAENADAIALYHTHGFQVERLTLTKYLERKS